MVPIEAIRQKQAEAPITTAHIQHAESVGLEMWQKLCPPLPRMVAGLIEVACGYFVELLIDLIKILNCSGIHDASQSTN